MSKSNTTIRIFKYRLYPKARHTRNLFRILNGARHLYNMALAEHRYVWETQGRSATSHELEQLAKQYRAKMPYGQQMFSQTAQSVIQQLNLAFASFFRRIKAGETPGYPRFKSATQFNSLLFKQYGSGVKIDGRRLKLYGIGRVAVRWHRLLEGKIKTVRLLHKAGQWFVLFTCQMPNSPPLPKTSRAIGIDVGLSALITTSEGEKVEHPQFYRLAQKRLRVLQRSLTRKQKGNHNRRKALLKVQRQYRHIANQRRDVQHKLTFTLVQQYDVIGVEKLKIKNMARNKHLSKSILDAGWGLFKQLLTSKAESAGRDVMFVHPAHTSRTCSRCGTPFVKFDLSVRWVECRCGLSLDRDHNAAINILKKTGWDASAGANVECG
jgi:putative transposase